MLRINEIISLSCAGPRPNQEDYIIAPIEEKGRVYVLCDGMGGHGHGEVASKTVAEAVFDYLKKLNPEEYLPCHLQEATDYAMLALKRADTFTEDKKKMGTTLVVAVFNRNEVLIGHIGDSRAYLLTPDGKIVFRTKDHSIVQEAVDAEILTEEEAWDNPKKNIITRCMASDRTDVKIDVDRLEIDSDSILILCSDGVSDTLRDKELQAAIINRKPTEIMSVIETQCNLSAKDNFSFVLLTVSQDERRETGKRYDIERDNRKEKTEKKESYFRACPKCGRGLSPTASFCPACGNRTIASSLHEETDVNVKKERKAGIVKALAELNPFTLLGVGAAVGCAVALAITGCVVHHAETVPLEPQDPAMAPPLCPNIRLHDGNGYIDQEAMNRFMEEISATDPSTPTDTLLVKSELMEEYKEFLQENEKIFEDSDRLKQEDTL